MHAWNDTRKLISYASGGIMSKVIRKTDYSNVTLFSMAAGTDISEHTAKREGLVYVIEGKGVFTLGGEDIDMLPGVVIFLPKDAVHSLKADGNTSFLLALWG